MGAGTVRERRLVWGLVWRRGEGWCGRLGFGGVQRRGGVLGI